MKKITLIFSVFMLSLSTNVANAQTTSGQCGDNLYYTYDDSSGHLSITGTGSMYRYSFSAIYYEPNGTVYFSTAPWSGPYRKLTSVSFPNGITSIGSYAFYGCSGLTGSLTIPNSVTSIDAFAFQHCSGLTSVTIGNSVTSISADAFSNCSNLTTVNFNATNCTSMETNTTNAYFSVFRSCPALTTLNIGNNVTNIPRFAFTGCSTLTSLTIPNSVTALGSSAFSGCSGLTGTLNIPNSITSIASYTFSNCGGLTSVTIANSVTSIGFSAFSGCSGLTGVLNIPNSVTSIGTYAFNGCIGLTSLTIPHSVTSLGSSAFSDCSDLTIVNFNATNCTAMGYDSGYSTPVFENCPALTTLNIGNNVKNIPKNAFRNCSSLTGALTIPDSVTSIGDNAFYGCSGLAGSLTIPNSVTSIGINAFRDCSDLTSVTIGNAVISIGTFAFANSSGLTTVNFNATNCTTMGIYNGYVSPVFENCPALTTLNIGSNVTRIPGYAFQNCSGLISLTIPTSVTSIGNSAFSGCSGLTSVVNLRLTPQVVHPNVFSTGTYSNATLYVPFTSLALYRAATTVGWKDFNNIKPLDALFDTDVSDIIVPEEGILVVPEDISARVAWSVNLDATKYTLVIYEDEHRTKIVCLLELDAAGHLIGISFPLQAKQKMQTAAAEDVLGVKINNLSRNTTYFYTMQTFSENDIVIDTKEGTFITTGGVPTGIVETQCIASLRVAGYYSILGQKLPKEPKSGLYIIMYENGKTEKVVK